MLHYDYSAGTSTVILVPSNPLQSGTWLKCQFQLMKTFKWKIFKPFLKNINASWKMFGVKAAIFFMLLILPKRNYRANLGIKVVERITRTKLKKLNSLNFEFRVILLLDLWVTKFREPRLAISTCI